MIAFAGVSKRFGALRVLDGVTLEARPGRVLALVGPNGSGKTTLIRIALGLTRASGGAVLVDGVPADRDGAYRSVIGYMPQIARFPDNLRVRDLIELVTAFRPGAPRDEELLSAFGLVADGEKTLGTLSGGTRQKVNAVIAFLFCPSLLILDEPTAGLDPVASGVLKDKIARVRAEGRTVIVTSHVLSELESIADDVAFLCEGAMRFVGPVAHLLEVTGQASLERAVAALMREGISRSGSVEAPQRNSKPATRATPALSATHATHAERTARAARGLA